MRKGVDFNVYYSIVKKYNLVPYSYLKLKLYVNYMDSLFGHVPINGKRMIDIGAGSGLFSLYGVLSGAQDVVALDPELGGSKEGTLTRLDILGQVFSNIVVKKITFQEYNVDEPQFDIILLHNSINHLDEEACSNLLDDPGAINKYHIIFEKISNLAAPNAKLIICECSRHNIFAKFKLRNPLAPTINWRIHQSPELWVAMLSEHRFGNHQVFWILPQFPVCISGELRKILGYLTMSHFCLYMDKL